MEFLYHRDPDSTKIDYGHALLLAGSYGKMGAAILAARACLRSGVGLLTVHVPRKGVDIMQTAVPEAMLSIDDDDCCFSSLPLNLRRYNAIAAGPGLGTAKCTQNALLKVAEFAKEESIPMIFDADAINIFALNPGKLALMYNSVITPHFREYERLFDKADPQDMAEKHNIVIVKKSHQTQIFSPKCKPIVNMNGNAGMATAGSGDVLTGIMLALFAQNEAYEINHRLFDKARSHQLAALAVEIHGDAGDRAASLRSKPSMIASDIVDAINIVGC